MKRFIYTGLFFIVISLHGMMPRRMPNYYFHDNNLSVLSGFENRHRSSENRSVVSLDQLESISLQVRILSAVMSLQNSDEKTERTNYSPRSCNIKRDY